MSFLKTKSFEGCASIDALHSYLHNEGFYKWDDNRFSPSRMGLTLNTEQIVAKINKLQDLLPCSCKESHDRLRIGNDGRVTILFPEEVIGTSAEKLKTVVAFLNNAVGTNLQPLPTHVPLTAEQQLRADCLDMYHARIQKGTVGTLSGGVKITISDAEAQIAKAEQGLKLTAGEVADLKANLVKNTAAYQ